MASRLKEPLALGLSPDNLPVVRWLTQPVMLGGAPNITGRYGRIQTRVVGGEVQEGALYKESPVKDSFGGGSNWDIVYLGIDASRSSGIYGTSTGVQPLSVQTLPCIKT